jgi:hypothetical protein
MGGRIWRWNSCAASCWRIGWRLATVRRAPEDWSGSVDMDPDDYVGLKEDDIPPGFHELFEFLNETNN